MNHMSALYFEETEELLQKVEYILIRLETDYSTNEINELFRIVHSIKGSSQMMGYDYIGNLTHKLEDMLDKVRKNELEMNNEVLRICFQGFDLVKEMFEAHKNGHNEHAEILVSEANKVENNISKILKNYNPASREEETNQKAISHNSLLNKLKNTDQLGSRRFYITITFANDIQMVAATLYMIFNGIKEIGSIVYTNITDEDLSGMSPEKKLTSCEMIICTELDMAELYPYFEITYIDKVTIIDIRNCTSSRLDMPSRSTIMFFETLFEVFTKIKEILYCSTNSASINDINKLFSKQRELIENKGIAFHEHPTIQILIGETTSFLYNCHYATYKKKKFDEGWKKLLGIEFERLFELVYGSIRGGLLYRVYKARNASFIDNFISYVERIDKSITRKLLLDISELEIVHETELKELIKLKRNLNNKGIILSLIVHPLSKNIINIFEAIHSIEAFPIYYTERDAVLNTSI